MNSSQQIIELTSASLRRDVVIGLIIVNYDTSVMFRQGRQTGGVMGRGVGMLESGDMGIGIREVGRGEG